MPRATYRLQLNAGFTFDDAAAVTGYLARLGVSHAYCSPYLKAAAGSMHGYDVTDHSRINDELGGEAAHGRFTDALARDGLGHVLDVVPNHMAISDASNAWWWDVLKNGPSSPYARCFDIDWDPPEAVLHRTILVPILGDHYGRVLEAGELKLARRDGETVLRYHEHVLPVAPESVHGDLDEINADPDALHEILEKQHYRVAFWKSGDRDLNYRRFFDIKSLAALRIEDEDVFEETHRLVLSLIENGKLDGLRIDHIDGLRDPAMYLDRLRERAPDAYLVVEKILEAGEDLPETWPVEGTTGYDFLNVVNGLFVDTTAEKAMSDVYLEFTKKPADLAEMIRANKLFIMREILASDVERLTALFVEVSEGHRRYRDYTRHELREAIRETIAAFPVYRTYLDTRTRTPRPQDVAHVQEAIEEAAARRPDLSPELFEFLCNLLLMRFPDPTRAMDEFVLRFQQTTGPVMAKGVEDTVFYNFNRLTSLNEVGSDLGCFGISLEAFHDHAARAQETWPQAMLATSTHDTKRSEDVRARIDLLSEIPAQWGDAVARWKDLNDRHRNAGIPDRNAEYLLYQTLVGAWPLSGDRAVAYMEKASKEAKAHTSWTDPSPDYDEGLAAFVRAVLDDPQFVSEVEEFVAPLVEPGRLNSLAQTAIKLTYPGVPDLYQGAELWDLSLVDPDNRRPVDYELRARLLGDVESGDAAAALARMDEGLPKLFLIQRLLALRARDPDAFGPQSTYEALWATGPRARHVVAFVRSGRVLTVAPRLPLTLEGEWRETHLVLPPGDWTDVLTGTTFSGAVQVEELLSGFPVLVATREGVAG